MRLWGIRHVRWLMVWLAVGEIKPSIVPCDSDSMLQRVWIRQRLRHIWRGCQ